MDAVEVNISSPNTVGLRNFHNPAALSELLEAVNEHRRRPMFMKMPTFPEKDQHPARHDMALSLVESCVPAGAGLTIANTRPVTDDRLSVGSGGISGRPIFQQMLRMVSEVRAVVGDATSINACGGVFTADDAWQALSAGADTVQLLTGMVYRGPGLARTISRDLAAKVDSRGMTSIQDLRRQPADACPKNGII